MPTSVGLALLLAWTCSFAAAPNVAFYYGPDPPWDELHAFDIVVVEPGHGFRAPLRSMTGTSLFAYVSAGEVEYERPYARELPDKAITGANEPWKSHVVDQTHPEWPQFFVERIVGPLWDEGYRGFFLDNLDSFQLISRTEEDRTRQAQALVGVIRLLRERYPEAKLIFNRGFEILPDVHQEVYAVAAESLFRGWDAKNSKYVAVPESDRNWLLGQLARVRGEFNLPVIAIDYVAPASRDIARETARMIAGLGFVPWVTSSELDQLGVGAIEVLPRKVLMLYDGGGDERRVYDERVHAYAAMPLNHLGYAVDYADVSQPLPLSTLAGRYAGIVMWFSDGRQSPRTEFVQWLVRQREHGVRMVIFGSFPFPLSHMLARRFGMSAGGPGSVRSISIDHRDPVIGFESEPVADVRYFVPLQADAALPLLRWRSDTGEVMDAAALTPWGGYVLSPNDIVVSPLAGSRWVLDPFEFLRRALALPAMPVPDVTTENGRRLMFVQVDGDGFVRPAERSGSPLASEVLLADVLQRYRVPHTVSVIQGEIAPNGAYPRLAAVAESVAKRIFALPHVEIGSHSYSHPQRWSAAPAVAGAPLYHVQIPGYAFDLDTEIAGAISYIDTRLAPRGKRTRMFFWSGDTQPGREALERVHRAGVLNMNGGGAGLDRSKPSVSTLWPLGMPKGPHFQVYAPHSSENFHTNRWAGPYGGYARVVEAFELTERPRRLRPLHVHYHVFSASKRASLDALHKVYRWTAGQRVMHVYASEYAEKVLDFRRFVVARAPDGWLLRGAGALRQVRLLREIGVPDVGSSRNIAGFERNADEYYVHLASGDAVLSVAPAAPRVPFVVEANGRIDGWQQSGVRTVFSVRAHTPLRFTLANASKCQVEGDGSPLAGIARDGATAYELTKNAIERISITCAS